MAGVFPPSQAEAQSGARSCTHVQRLEAVPAEGVFAVLTHHLGAPLVPLDVDLALGAAFDGCVVLLQFESRAAGGESISGRLRRAGWGGGCRQDQRGCNH